VNGNQSISIDRLTALNDEVAALVRAGVPLDKGLTELGREMKGSQGSLAEWLGARLAAGASLEQLLQRDDTTFPPVWRAVVLAGLRSGNLAAALEGMAETGRQIVDLRRTIILALIYPVLLVVLGFLLFLLVVFHTIPAIADAFHNLTSSSSSNLIVGLLWLRVHWMWWAPWLPLAVFAILGLWLWRAWRLPTTRPKVRYRRARRTWWGWRSMRGMLHDGQMATFSEVLALLHQHEVPLPDALVLAAEASGDATMARDTREFSAQLKAGHVVQRRADLPASLPPLLAWSVSNTTSPGNLTRTLLNSARAYRDRAEKAARWAAIYMPIYMSVIIGGTIVLLLGLMLFVPFTQLLYALGLPM